MPQCLCCPDLGHRPCFILLQPLAQVLRVLPCAALLEALAVVYQPEMARPTSLLRCAHARRMLD